MERVEKRGSSTSISEGRRETASKVAVDEDPDRRRRVLCYRRTESGA